MKIGVVGIIGPAGKNRLLGLVCEVLSLCRSFQVDAARPVEISADTPDDAMLPGGWGK